MATPLNPIPYARRRVRRDESQTNDDDGRLRAQRGAAGRQQDAPRALPQGRATCSATEEDFGRTRTRLQQAGPLQHRLARRQLQRRGAGARRRSTVPAEDGRLMGAVQAGGLTPGRRAVRAGRGLLLGALLRRERRARSRTPGTARARGSSTSRTRRTRSRSRTGGLTTRSSGRRTSAAATSTPPITCAASTCCG